MTVFARLEVIPIEEDSLAEEIANAVAVLDEFDISYETTPMDTVIQSDSVEEVFAAAEAAHGAVDTNRVITSLEIDDQRDRDQQLSDRITAIEEELGKPPADNGG